MSKRVLPLSWALVAALCALPAAAQLNYKSIMPDGKVIYGDKPAPGAVKVEQLKGAPSKGVSVVTPKEAATAREMEGARGRQVGGERVRAAEAALKRAEAAMAAGKEPQEGDRIGTASGGQRFSDAYWERQKRLQAEYEQARASYDRAVREANEPAASRSSPTPGTVNRDGTGGGTPGSAGSASGRKITGQ